MPPKAADRARDVRLMGVIRLIDMLIVVLEAILRSLVGELSSRGAAGLYSI